MTSQVNHARRNFLTGRNERSTITDAAQTYRLDVSDRCLPYQNVVCEACRDSCEVNAIRFPPRLREAARPVIDSQTCIGCGDCVAACPVGAVSIEALVNQSESPE